MTDAEFMFREDSREKKKTGHSAAKRVGRRKGCKFPSDYMTSKEIKRMNGECKTYNLSAPMKWAEYKKVPAEIRRKYIVSLEDKYQATTGQLADMFGVSGETVRVERTSIGLPPKKKGGYNKSTPEWKNFLAYGTPAREVTPIRDLIPEELREKLDRYEHEHPQVKANVERVREENAAVNEESTPEPAAQPVGYVLTDSDAMMLSNIHGILLILSAADNNPTLSALLKTSAGDVQRLVSAWMEVQG